MNRLLNGLYPVAQGAALLALLGAAATAARHHPVALGMVLLIAAFFVLGAWELQRARRGLLEWRDALGQLEALSPQAFADWSQGAQASDLPPLLDLPPGPRQSLQARLTGHLSLTAPPWAGQGLSIVPLAGALSALLVLLGMLGTFLGLVLTLGGTAQALSATGDLASLRTALGAPVQGLGLAFSCSVAGVAASAMLGLMTALVRREQAEVAARLEALLRGPMRGCTAAARQARRAEQDRQQAQSAAQAQAVALEQAREREQRSQRAWLEAWGERSLQTAVDRLSARLLTGLQETLSGPWQDSAREAGVAVREAATLNLAQSLAQSQEQARALQTALASQLQDQVRQHLQASVQQQQAAVQTLEAGFAARTHELLAQLQQQQAEALAAQQAGWQRAWADGQAAQTQQAQAQAQHQQALTDALQVRTEALVTQTEAQSRTLLHEVATLLQAAGEAPRAAAEAVQGLREQLQQSQLLDRQFLAERADLMQTVSTLLANLQQAAGAQSATLDQLVQSAAAQLAQASAQFEQQAARSSTRLQEAALHIAAGAAELGSWGEGFVQAVAELRSSHATLGQHLEGLQAQLVAHAARSDDQLAYTVAQARELIELSVATQKQVLDGLQGVAGAVVAGAGGTGHAG